MHTPNNSVTLIDRSSETRIDLLAFCLLNVGMKSIDDIRRENLAELVAEFHGITPLAARLDRSHSQVSQLLTGAKDSKTGKRRGMRSTTARYIEDRCGKPGGWMDSEHPSANNLAVASVSHSQSTTSPEITGAQSIEKGLDAAAQLIVNNPEKLTAQHIAAFRYAIAKMESLAVDRLLNPEKDLDK